MKLLNGAPTPDDDDAALAADLRVVSGARLGSGPELGIHLATRLIHLPGFGHSGDGGHFGAGANVSGLSLDTRVGRSGLTDFRFTSGVGLFTLYRRSIEDDGRGWDFLASGGVGYDIRQHSWDAGPMDGWSSVHVPGLQLQLRRMDGPFRLTLRTDLALTFGGARSFLLDGAPDTFAQESLTTTQRAWGYTLGWGIAAAPAIEVAYGPVALDLGAAIDTRYALNRPDPWVDRHPDARLTDSWSSLHTGIRVKLPWNDLQLSSSIERNLRRGSGNGTSRTARETVVLAGLGFAL
jgi:hypothetical protein